MQLVSCVCIKVQQILSDSSQEGLCFMTCGGTQTYFSLRKATVIQSASEQRESQECYEQTRLKYNLSTSQHYYWKDHCGWKVCKLTT